MSKRSLMLPEPCVVNAADRWEEGCRSYPRRSYGRGRVLLNGGYEKHDGRTERLPPQKDTNVYQEAMEETENKSSKPVKALTSRMESLRGGIFLKRAIGVHHIMPPYMLPYQTKDLHAVDIMTYPKRTSLCTIYD